MKYLLYTCENSIKNKKYLTISVKIQSPYYASQFFLCIATKIFLSNQLRLRCLKLYVQEFQINVQYSQPWLVHVHEVIRSNAYAHIERKYFLIGPVRNSHNQL